MIIQTLSVLILFLLKQGATYATMWPIQGHSELNLYLQGFTLESLQVDTIFECYRKCEDNKRCASININLTNRTCELKYSTKTTHPEMIVSQQNTIYIKIREHKEPGSGPDNPIINCKSLNESDSQAKSGVYWMKFNEPSSEPFQVFCDMTTDGGGWTLVYSYTFTKYDYFSHPDNAVTPIPTWPLDFTSYRFVPRSNTTPINESSHSAMDFALWKKIGSEFLIAPNIINWYACKEGTGSFVNWQPGTLTCREVKNLIPPRSQDCAMRAPNSISMSACGVLMKSSSSSKMINLNGRVDGCFPVHDSCGTGTTKTDHLRNIPNPGGKLYIR